MIDTLEVLMEIREIRAFMTVAQELNFRKAAEALGMSQPPLTRLISNLEYHLGVKLFHRSTRSVELTGEGVHFLSRARQIVQDVEKLEADLKSLSKNRASGLRVFLHPTAMHSSIPKLISSYKKQFPNVRFEFAQCTFRSIENKLRKGDIDFAFGINNSKSSDIRQVEVQSYELGFLVPESHPLARKKVMKLVDLEGQTLIFHPRNEDLGFQKEFARFLRLNKVKVNLYYKKSTESCPGLVSHQKGLLLTSKKLVPDVPGSVFVPLNDYYPKLRIYATWSSTLDSPQGKAFMSFLEEQSLIPHSEMDYHLD